MANIPGITLPESKAPTKGQGTVLPNQSVYDLCLMTYGSLDYLGKFMTENKIIGLNSAPLPGSHFIFDLDKRQNEARNKYNSQSGIKYATLEVAPPYEKRPPFCTFYEILTDTDFNVPADWTVTTNTGSGVISGGKFIQTTGTAATITRAMQPLILPSGDIKQLHVRFITGSINDNVGGGVNMFNGTIYQDIYTFLDLAPFTVYEATFPVPSNYFNGQTSVGVVLKKINTGTAGNINEITFASIQVCV